MTFLHFILDFDALKELLCETFLRIENEQSAALVGPNPTTVVSKDFEGNSSTNEHKSVPIYPNKFILNLLSAIN